MPQTFTATSRRREEARTNPELAGNLIPVVAPEMITAEDVTPRSHSARTDLHHSTRRSSPVHQPSDNDKNKNQRAISHTPHPSKQKDDEQERTTVTHKKGKIILPQSSSGAFLAQESVTLYQSRSPAPSHQED